MKYKKKMCGFIYSLENKTIQQLICIRILINALPQLILIMLIGWTNKTSEWITMFIHSDVLFTNNSWSQRLLIESEHSPNQLLNFKMMQLIQFEVPAIWRMSLFQPHIFVSAEWLLLDYLIFQNVFKSIFKREFGHFTVQFCKANIT